jgi:signal transduction histidine kinase
MLLPASPEFIALCRTQIALLTQGLGASLAIVYLTEELTESFDANLLPIVAYPDAAATWDPRAVLTVLTGRVEQRPLLLSPGSPTLGSALPPVPPSSDEMDSATPPPVMQQGLAASQQMVLPLVQDGVMMGLLVTARAERPWVDVEKAQIERIAHTLALACLMDQRGQWLEQDLGQKHLARAQQHEMFDNLLHQFRNPLTALRTFGKLMIKRLRADDPNREVAEGIVRESDRLEELLKQFDVAVDLDEPKLLPSSSLDLKEWEAKIDTDLRNRISAHPQPSLSQSSEASEPVLLLPETHYLTGGHLTMSPHLLTDILIPLLSTATAIAQDRQLDLVANLPPDLPPVETDDKALREVLNNLLDNALKYTPVGGQIFVDIVQDFDRQGLLVADTGPGIPLDDQERLFERNYRGVQAQTDIPGTGLGLAIAQDLVHQLGGEIEIVSPARECLWLQQTIAQFPPDQPGTVCIVWLPNEQRPSVQ